MELVSVVDLHVHTYYSDGKFSPEETVRRAAAMGLETLAITDHDNAQGAREARPAANELGIELVPGIEFTCNWPECRPTEGSIDVLGYFVDLDDPEFQAFERAELEDLSERIVDCCADLTACGYPLTLEDVRAQNRRYTGLLPLIQAVQSLHQITAWEAASQLVDVSWKRVRENAFPPEDVIEHIHRAGGLAVLAHPSLIRCKGAWLQTDQIQSLVDMGLDGLEIYHPRMNEMDRAYFLSLARRYDLLTTGGSDEHGWFTDLTRLGCQPVPLDTCAALRARRASRR
jgi:predicted metal-dependent phosphoesterase TrpH